MDSLVTVAVYGLRHTLRPTVPLEFRVHLPRWQGTAVDVLLPIALSLCLSLLPSSALAVGGSQGEVVERSREMGQENPGMGPPVAAYERYSDKR